MRRVAVLLFFLHAQLGHSQALVFDAAAVQEAIQHGVLLSQQIDELKKQYESLTGSRGMGDLLNGANEQALRAILPEDWEQLMEAIRTGNQAGMSSAVSAILESLKEQHPLMKGADYAELESHQSLAKSWQRSANTAMAGMSVAEVAFNQTQNHRETYEAFLEELNNTKDAKASTDLLARINIENGLMMNEMMRLQAVLLQLQASQVQRGLAADERTRNDNRLK